MEPDVLISVKNLTRLYGKNKLAVKVLDVKDLEIRRGEFIALTGPSGCGKTTLLNLLGALDRPSGGDITFEGKKIFGRGEVSLCRFRREKIGFIFQAYHLIPTLSALKNVMAPAFPLGSGYKRRAMELLRQVGLAGKEGRRPDDLSGGEQQRVAIARALLLEPDLILADEPTGNLDSVNGRGIMDLLKKLNQRGKTVLVATHDQRLAEDCGRVIRLADGSIEEH
ncbi:cell division transporter ATP-binding protein FtsE [Desulfocucumis palustris]|uniref:Cell division transporter ATP-binding protein FtsE n=1 Tax=Desulfocucumis palustris TaxID=1898651 RepID=A0A2L2XCE0_9FIRM|nr:ABC transporter ATP-binding protein [Desulfocucumis palustris]GBF33908.1 cell division transporter ATP-binding protein FtsE [Desulfocucumis palustris]